MTDETKPETYDQWRERIINEGRVFDVERDRASRAPFGCVLLIWRRA